MLYKYQMKNKPKHLSVSLAIAVVSTSLVASPVSAQPALEEIVVTAQKRDEGIMDVPIAITVTTDAQLKRDQVYTLTDLQRTTPALEVAQNSGGQENGGGRLRGIGTNIGEVTAAPSVAIVIDDMPAGNTTFPQIFDLAQVEVLLGPQGTLFGQTASAGVINITTKKPNFDEFEGSLGLDYSNKGTLNSEYGQEVYRGVLNIPLTDVSALRIAGFMKIESGVQENVLLGKDNEESVTSLRVKYLIAPTDTFTAEVTGEYNDLTLDGSNFYSISQAPTNTASAAAYSTSTCGVTIREDAKEYCSSEMDDIDKTITAISADLQWAFTDFTLTSLTTYRDREQNIDVNEYSRLTPLPVASQKLTKETSDLFSTELRVTTSFDDALNYIAGVYYSESSFEQSPLSNNYQDPLDPVGFSVCNAAGFCPVPPNFTAENGSIDSYAVYADLTYDVSDAVTIFGGLRYTNYDVEVTTALNDDPIKNKDGSTETNVSGRLGFSYNTNNSSMFYATLARGFKGQVIDVPVDVSEETTILEPEISTALELGYKTSLNDSMDLGMNLFWTKIDNFQVQRSIFVGTALVSKLEGVDVETKGIEFSIRGVVGDALSYYLGYIYADAAYPDDYLGADGGSLGGRQVVGAPKQKLTLSGEYIWPMEATEAFLTLNTYYKGDVRYHARSTDDFVYGAHVSVGGSIGWRAKDNSWTVSAFGRNLTGEDAPIAYLASTYFGAVDGGVRAWPAGGITRRQVGVSVDYNF